MSLPRPVYQSERVALYCGDCREILPALGRFDAMITDPPYGIQAVDRGRCFGTSNACATNVYRPIVGDDRPFDPAHLLGAAATLCLWGANHYSDKLPRSACWLVWDKRDGCKSNPLADCELAWTNRDAPARLLSHRWMGMIRESERERRVHPSQKPAALMRWALETLEVPASASVVDCYMGSGPVGLACIQTGRRFVGIEIDEEYCRIAAARIAAEESQLALFGSSAAPVRSSAASGSPAAMAFDLFSGGGGA